MTTQDDFSKGRTVGAIWAQKRVLEAVLSELQDACDAIGRHRGSHRLSSARTWLGGAIDELEAYLELREKV